MSYCVDCGLDLAAEEECEQCGKCLDCCGCETEDEELDPVAWAPDELGEEEDDLERDRR